MRKFYKVLFIIIIVVCFFFLLNDRLFFKNNPLKEIYKVIIIPVNKISMEFDAIRNYKSISEDNNRLEKDNILLNNLKEENSVLSLENKQLKDKLIEINEVINGYMPNQYAMCKAFDEIEFIISKEVE